MGRHESVWAWWRSARRAPFLQSGREASEGLASVCSVWRVFGRSGLHWRLRHTRHIRPSRREGRHESVGLLAYIVRGRQVKQSVWRAFGQTAIAPDMLLEEENEDSSYRQGVDSGEWKAIVRDSEEWRAIVRSG